MRAILIGLAAAVATAGVAAADTNYLALTFVGNDAVFVDTDNIKRKGDVAEFRFLKVVQKGQTIMEKPYTAAWFEASIDCKAHTYTALSQTLVLTSGDIAAKQYLRGDVYPVTMGTPEAGLEDAICKNIPDFPDRVATVPEAVKLGLAKMGDAVVQAKAQ